MVKGGDEACLRLRCCGRVADEDPGILPPRGPWGAYSGGMHNLLQGIDNDSHPLNLSHAKFLIPISQCTIMMDDMLLIPCSRSQAANYKKLRLTQSKCLALHQSSSSSASLNSP